MARATRVPVSCGDEGIAAFARHAAGIANALEIPVLVAVVGVKLPVVPAAGVAAVAVQRNIEVGKLRGGTVGDAVDSRVDRVPVGIRVHGDTGRGILRQSNAGEDERDDRGSHVHLLGDGDGGRWQTWWCPALLTAVTVTIAGEGTDLGAV